MGHIRSMVADPEGRFLLMQGYADPSIFQIDLVGASRVPQAIYSTADESQLFQTTTMRLIGIQGTPERLVILTQSRDGVTPLGSQDVVIRDDDNNGVPESIQSLSSAQWAVSAWADTSTWDLLTGVH